MINTQAPEYVQSLIVLSKARKAFLANAVKDARSALEASAQTTWEPYVETAEQKRANARAARIAWLAESC